MIIYISTFLWIFSKTFYRMHRSIKMTGYTMFFLVCITLTPVRSSDLVQHDISTQSKCVEVERPRTLDCRWKIGLYHDMDYVILKGKIAAFKLQWFSGSWSGWYVPGINDLDGKFNINAVSCGSYPQKGNSMRRMWSYFYDHTHKYILCNWKVVFTWRR